ncbi:hypothetical protein Q8A73_019330 [Channa argus]|nr:hypothetical protein Q8A73_019330 [Channa argus]
MFHRFHVSQEDRDYFRFLWWENGDTSLEPKEYRMKVHLFGAASSPGCANYGMKYLASQNEKEYPAAANFIRKNFYVDDGLISVDSVNTAIHLVREAQSVCAKGKLHLHKFISNNRAVLETIPDSKRAGEIHDVGLNYDEYPGQTVLGIKWNVTSDTFSFKVNLDEKPATRRGILSTVASVFDPLGFLAPFLLLGKKILQEMCQRGIGWDEPLCKELKPQWESWLQDLKNLQQLQVPRCLVPFESSKIQRIELHHFSDASSLGYGQCSYIRVVSEDKVHCFLVIGKARVAPTKVVTIPRLELTAAVVSAVISSMLKEELELKIDQEYFWTDSRVVLGYINNEARRGLKVDELISSNWFTGPKFLWEREIVTQKSTPELLGGILRVGGRLKRASLPLDLRHPIILPKDGVITRLILDYFHGKTQHQGRGQTLNELRANGYWIVGGSKVVTNYLRQCVACRRARRPTETQRMADLPANRVDPSPPFSYCGMDCFGPLYTKQGRKEYKRYGLIFTCLSSRAVHIEMLEDLTTDAFINALRCFIAIRGTVRQIRSDQGTNFVGAKNELAKALKEVDKDILSTYMAERQCDFIMNAPDASHMGGVWERQIRTVRSVLSWALSQSAGRLDDACLRTFLYEAMSIVNSRPLTTDNLNDPKSLEPLTPNLLLTMKTSVALPPPGKFVAEDLYARKRWRRVQYLAEQFWSRWRKEYLVNLTLRQRWHSPRRNVKIGDIVIVKEEGVPRNEWKLGRVLDARMEEDGLVRKATVQIGNRELGEDGQRLVNPSVLERPIHKLVVLVENN